MAREIVVKLSSNARYWQADWMDSHGKRRKKSLGSKTELSRRQAMKLCQRLQNELSKKPGLADARKSPPLGKYIDSYIISRSDLKSGTRYLHRLTRKYLTKFFPEETAIDQISRVAAREWQTALAAGQLSDDRPMAPPTVRGHVVNAKSIFRQAVDDELIAFNPFDRLSIPLPKVSKDWHYVDQEQFEKLLSASPSVGWKILLALCRLAGLRRGEAMSLPWSGVDFQKRRLTVNATKTQRHGESRRVVPVDEKLYPILIEALESAKPNQELVCDVNPHCLWRNFTVIRKKAGLVEWDDAFQVMRRNCETDWAQRFPQYAVSEWLGHDIAVSAEFYLAVTDDLYQKAAGKPSDGEDANVKDARFAPKSAPKPQDTS
jgi:integrase